MASKSSIAAFIRKRGKYALPLVWFLVFLLLGEVAIRVYHAVLAPPRTIELDERLGWRAAANVTSDHTAEDAEGKAYSVRYRTEDHGFRFFGDTASSAPKLLVLGSSFTHAVEVSNEDTYYARIKDDLGVELFACGVGGHGSLQQFLMLDQYVDRIAPDLVLWQLCPNDLINNSFDLEWRSRINNNSTRRPYLSPDGAISYALPRPFASVRRFARAHLHFVSFLFFRIDRRGASKRDSVEFEIAAVGAKHEGLRRSARITQEIFRRAKERCTGVPVVAFCVPEQQPFSDEMRRIAIDQGFLYCDSVIGALAEADASGTCLFAADGTHWNAAGHRVVGGQLAEFIRKHQLLETRRPKPPSRQTPGQSKGSPP